LKCFLHIGVEKTGSTALQHFLNLNREKLTGYGYYLPESAGKINHTRLAIAAYDHDRRDGLTVSMGIRNDAGDLAGFQQKTIEDLNKEIAIASSLPSPLKIIFSSEHFQSRLTRSDEIHRLREIITALGIGEVKVIIYLRDPVEIANSLFSTAIKSGHTIKNPPPPDNPYFNHVCNHKNTLEQFGSVFGKDALIPRLYTPTDLVNGSIIEDFFHVTGIPADKVYLFPEKLNETLSATGISVLRKINEIIPRIVDDRINPLRADIVKYFEKHFSRPKYMMPDELIEQYRQVFKESNEWVRMNYFPHKTSIFQGEFDQKSTGFILPEEEAGRIASLIADIWISKHNGKI